MSRSRYHHRRPAWQPPITHAEIDTLAEELTADLARHAAEPGEVGAVLSRWLGEQGVERLAFIGLAVVRDVFGHHLTRVPTGQLPPGAMTFQEGPET
jgi:hypothetical protein